MKAFWRPRGKVADAEAGQSGKVSLKAIDECSGCGEDNGDSDVRLGRRIKRIARRGPGADDDDPAEVLDHSLSQSPLVRQRGHLGLDGASTGEQLPTRAPRRVGPRGRYPGTSASRAAGGCPGGRSKRPLTPCTRAVIDAGVRYTQGGAGRGAHGGAGSGGGHLPARGQTHAGNLLQGRSPPQPGGANPASA